MMRALLLALSSRPAIGRTLSRLAPTRRLVRRFVAGERLEDALEVVHRLNAAGLESALTYLGENVRSAEGAAAAAGVYLEALDEIKRRGLRCSPSLKLTQVGLDLSDAACVATMRRVLDRAHAHGILVWIDMEQSVYTDRTLAIWETLRRDFPQTGCVIQAYLRRSAADIERLAALGATVRLCKGAYREPGTVAFPDKTDVDAAYARLMDRLLAPASLAAGTYPGFATHDERLQARAAAAGAPAEAWEYQMLYGIRDDLHGRVRARGGRLRVLVPFGEDWYGYFMRRLAERPANLAFLLRNLAR
jgi:proline dehydrogenase